MGHCLFVNEKQILGEIVPTKSSVYHQQGEGQTVDLGGGLVHLFLQHTVLAPETEHFVDGYICPASSSYTVTLMARVRLTVTLYKRTAARPDARVD
jgi:hypothetical protein